MLHCIALHYNDKLKACYRSIIRQRSLLKSSGDDGLFRSSNFANGNSVSLIAAGAAPSVLTQKKPRIQLAACGCVTAAKFGDLCREFSEWAEVKAVITKSSSQFIDLPSLAKDINLYRDEHEWLSWTLVNNYDYVLHIALASWADILVIAPLSAHTLAKIAGGLCDNLLTRIVRAWDYKKKPIFVAPSMNNVCGKILNCTADDSDIGTFIYSSGTDLFSEALTIPVPLTIVGSNYFFSDAGEGVQCQLGLAFEIDVKRGLGLPPSLNQPPPPPYAEPPSSDTDQSPPVTVGQSPSSSAFASQVDMRVVDYGFGAALLLLQFW